MPDATPIDAALTGLDELAACDLRLAKRFCARIEALPEDEDAKAMDLARSYQRMARSYRQTIVVQARLRRELKAEARQDAGDARTARRDRVRDLKAAIRAEIQPRIWTTEREDERCGELDALLHDLLDYAADRPDFLDLSPQTHVAAILEDLRLDAPQASPSGGRDAAQQQVADGGSEAGDGQTPPIGHSPSASSPPQMGETQLFNGRLAPPMELPAWLCDDDSS